MDLFVLGVRRSGILLFFFHLVCLASALFTKTSAPGIKCQGEVLLQGTSASLRNNGSAKEQVLLRGTKLNAKKQVHLRGTKFCSKEQELLGTKCCPKEQVLLQGTNVSPRNKGCFDKQVLLRGKSALQGTKAIRREHGLLKCYLSTDGKINVHVR